ncbi:short chain dehydrogenase [Thalassotalea insulae]|uniref:Short chain dehydrogenase n=1 Tax=Thalassotalea insulae TaxID=2056778 RepID=A0ABQ6GNG4_9GAMM|nr:SDR family oxidoreductase [Thalassotalea insulae]GLX77099.1 short chain dehydrogenase [Thalassotalea insulae]
MTQITKCLLTGATGGIGKAIAHRLANAGYSLILHGRDSNKLKQLQLELTGTHEVLACDLLVAEQRQKLLTQLKQRADISVLINNAGISAFGLFEHQDSQEIARQLTMNLTIPMQLTHALLSQIEFHQGSIINIGSAFGAIAFPCFTSYSASKFGLRGFSEALSRELANRSVHVGYFAPRTTATAINCAHVDEMNFALGNSVDSPEYVAQQLLTFITKKQKRMSIGWPEKFFARLNGFLPELVDNALAKKLKVICHYLPQLSLTQKKSHQQQESSNEIVK